jgi:hypothetical protein
MNGTAQNRDAWEAVGLSSMPPLSHYVRMHPQTHF